MRMFRSVSLAVLACGFCLAANASPITNPVEALRLHKARPAVQNTNKPALTPVATPEPSSIALLGTGVLGAAGMVRRRFRRA